MKDKNDKSTKKTSTNWEDVSSDSDNGEEYYTDEEEKLLDKYLKLTNNKISEEEIYEVMQRYHNDDIEVTDQLNYMVKLLGKGEEYGWQEIGKSK